MRPRAAKRANAMLVGTTLIPGLLLPLMSAYWPTAASDPAATEPERDFARIWLAMPKIVFSTTLRSVGWTSRLAGQAVQGANFDSALMPVLDGAAKSIPHEIRVLAGDKVTVEISPYDPKRGRITFRER